MKIDTMPAGREMDALVAEKIMGRRWLTFIHQSYLLTPEVIKSIYFSGSSWTLGKTAEWDSECNILTDLRHHRVPDYSTDIAAAWEVVEKLSERWSIVVGPVNQAPQDKPRKMMNRFWALGGGMATSVYADTAPLAICLGALKAEGIKV